MSAYECEVAVFWGGPADGLEVEIDEPHRVFPFAAGEQQTIGVTLGHVKSGVLWPQSQAKYVRARPNPKCVSNRVFYYWLPEKT